VWSENKLDEELTFVVVAFGLLCRGLAVLVLEVLDQESHRLWRVRTSGRVGL
jgi:hypothetical protein